MSKLVPNDKNSPVRFVSTLGDDLLVRSIQGKEKMGGLFVFQLELVSANKEISFDNVVGQQVTAVLVLDEGERNFNGIISEFRYLGFDGVYHKYYAIVRPWLWLLTRTSDCRVFQKMTVPEIIEKILKLNKMVDYKVNLKKESNEYRKWEYCVQYNESDFNFISRLMETEGIYYYFEHTAEKHIMVMADRNSAHSAFPGFEQVTFNSEVERLKTTLDSLDTWAAIQSFLPAKYASKVYDFENPKSDLLVPYIPPKRGHVWPIQEPEVFDYPGDFMTRKEGQDYTEVRLQEIQCQQERMKASGACRGLSPGYSFTLKDFPREDQNKEYLTISIEHDINNNAFFSNEGIMAPLYRCSIEVMPLDAKSNVNFRTPRKTPKPRVHGPQTAVVVGPKGDEIYTDEYGRVIVQFHWDRYGTSDENSSCWVRVSQLWAGTKWGGIHIPRIGQEVIVSFLEGDPDQPLITGNVYNANCMPPYTLPSDKTQSGIKSRRTLKGAADNFNEIRMEDKKGSEELYIQAEKNETILVKNDKSERVGHNEKINIGNDRSETVGNDETINVKHDREETVDNDETLSVGNDRERNVGNDESVVVGNDKSKSIGKNETITVGEKQQVDIGKDQNIGIAKNRGLNVAKDHNVSVGDNESRDIGKDLVINVGDSIMLKCGKASISMKKNGDIKIDGKNLVLKGSGKINLKASRDVILKGSKIAEN